MIVEVAQMSMKPSPTYHWTT